MPGVEVGYTTLVSGSDVRTGVTAIHPRGRSNPGDPCVAGYHSQNGNGEMTGVSWIHEAGYSSGPICITNTHAVGVAHAGIVAWTVKHHLPIAEAWLLPVAGETWDGYLNDINGHHVTEASAVLALEAAASGPIELGSVGGGTGHELLPVQGRLRVRLAGRRVRRDTAYTVGVFLQTNFGARPELQIAGVPFGELLADDNPMDEAFSAPPGAGSCIADRAHRRAAPAGPVRRARPARHARAGPDRDGWLALLGRPLPGRVGRQPRRDHAGLRDAPEPRAAPAGWTPSSSSRGASWTRSTRPSSRQRRRPSSTASWRTAEVTGFRGHRTPGLPRDRVVGELKRRGVIA